MQRPYKAIPLRGIAFSLSFWDRVGVRLPALQTKLAREFIRGLTI